MSAQYRLTPADHESIEEAAAWFLDQRKPATAAEVRKILVTLYVRGMKAGAGKIRSLIEELEP